MKYTYAYKTSDGVRHEASMDAPNRETVFSSLREKGIRAIKVVAADGSKANGEIRGVRKRVLVLSVLAAALAAGLAVSLAERERVERVVASPLPRQEIPGDRARIDGAADRVLSSKADRFFARFAEPGRPSAVSEADWPSDADVLAALAHPTDYAANAFTEHVMLARMVAAIKDELRAYLAGGGSVRDYLRALVRRQDREIAARRAAESRLEELLAADRLKDAYAYWLKANASLRDMGVFPLARPDRLDSFEADAQSLLDPL